ncbi:unnamed protein product [Mucor circinelloides]
MHPFKSNFNVYGAISDCSSPITKAHHLTGIYQSFMQLYNNRLQCLESKQADAEDDATVPRNDQNWKRPTTILV